MKEPKKIKDIERANEICKRKENEKGKKNDGKGEEEAIGRKGKTHSEAGNAAKVRKIGAARTEATKNNEDKRNNDEKGKRGEI